MTRGPLQALIVGSVVWSASSLISLHTKLACVAAHVLWLTRSNNESSDKAFSPESGQHSPIRAWRQVVQPLVAYANELCSIAQHQEAYAEKQCILLCTLLEAVVGMTTAALFMRHQSHLNVTAQQSC